MIVGSCSIMGISINRKLCERIRVLQEWIAALHEMKAEIVFRALPIPSILLRFAEQQNHFTAPYFSLVCKNLEPYGLQTAAKMAAPELRRLPLIETDLHELDHVFDAVGKYDGETQAEALNHAIAQLELQLEDARQQQAQKGRLYRAVGFSCGVALALIAI